MKALFKKVTYEFTRKNVSRLYLAIGIIIGLLTTGDFFINSFQDKKFAKSIYIDKEWNVTKKNKVSFIFLDDQIISSIVFPPDVESFIIKGIEVDTTKIINVTGNRYDNNKLIKINNESEITFEWIIKSSQTDNISKSQIIESIIFYSYDGSLIQHSYNYWHILKIVLIIIALLIILFRDALVRFTLGQEMDYSLGLKILSKIEEKFRDNRNLTVLSMDTIDDEDSNSIPLGLFAVWLIISRIYLEEKEMPCVELNTERDFDLDLIRNGSFDELLSKYTDHCLDSQGCELFKALQNKQFSSVNKKIALESISKCELEYCKIYKDYLISINNYHLEENLDSRLIRNKKFLNQAIRTAKTNYFKEIKQDFNGSQSFNNNSNFHVFAKIIIGNEADLEKKDIESLIVFYQLYEIPLFFIEKNSLEGYLKIHPDFWYNGKNKDLLIINDKYFYGYPPRYKLSWHSVEDQVEDFFNLLFNNELNAMLAYDRKNLYINKKEKEHERKKEKEIA